MQEQFVTFEIASELKELGYDESCFGIFDTAIQNKLCYGFSSEKGYTYNQFTWKAKTQIILSPLWQQVIDWFRKTKKIDIQILRNKPDYNEYKVEIYMINDNDTYLHLYIKDGDYIVWFSSYEEAREQAILKAIELCKK